MGQWALMASDPVISVRKAGLSRRQKSVLRDLFALRDTASHARLSASRPDGPVGFLLNHEGGHQAAHVLPIVRAFAHLHPDIAVPLIVAPGATEAEARRFLLDAPANIALKVMRGASTGARLATGLLGNAVPFDRISTLGQNLDLFRPLAALVVPEKTSLMLKARFGLSDLKMIHTRHGAGDRAVGFDKASARFDFVLLSGAKVRDRLQAAGAIGDGNYAMVGYPKFDLAQDRAPVRLFDNDRPTVVYNPHPTPALSSWFAMGEQILDHFANNPQYNLVFAPHVMLFAKRWSVSVSPPSIARVKAVAQRFHGLPNIRIDLGSAASVDMSYTRAADIYLGDASSQIYEFLTRPRPCIFLNPRRHDWREDANFSHWQAGDVLEDVTALGAALEKAVRNPSAYREAQEKLFSYTFDLNEVPSSVRAARAISEYLAMT